MSCLATDRSPTHGSLVRLEEVHCVSPEVLISDRDVYKDGGGGSSDDDDDDDDDDNNNNNNNNNNN